MSASTPAPARPVTVAITRQVRPEDEILMQAWADAGSTMARRFDGFLGSGWVRPAAGSLDWHMLYRFASPAHLEAWEQSRERQRWLASGQGLVQATRVEHRTGIEGWFDEPEERRAEDLGQGPPPAPPRWKQMVVIFTAFFPTSLALAYLLAPVTDGWPVVGRVLLTCAVAIPWMTYVFLPFVTRLYLPWTTGRPRR